VFHFLPFFKFKMPGVLSDGVLGKNWNLQILVDYDVILRVHPSSKVLKLNICL